MGVGDFSQVRAHSTNPTEELESSPQDSEPREPEATTGKEATIVLSLFK